MVLVGRSKSEIKIGKERDTIGELAVIQILDFPSEGLTMSAKAYGINAPNYFNYLNETWAVTVKSSNDKTPRQGEEIYSIKIPLSESIARPLLSQKLTALKKAELLNTFLRRADKELPGLLKIFRD